MKGLINQKEYLFRVRAKNAVGLGEPQEMLSSVTVKEQIGIPNDDQYEAAFH